MAMGAVCATPTVVRIFVMFQDVFLINFVLILRHGVLAQGVEHLVLLPSSLGLAGEIDKLIDGGARCAKKSPEQSGFGIK